jgi:hypothetical protein
VALQAVVERTARNSQRLHRASSGRPAGTVERSHRVLAEAVIQRVAVALRPISRPASEPSQNRTSMISRSRADSIKLSNYSSRPNLDRLPGLNGGTTTEASPALGSCLAVPALDRSQVEARASGRPRPLGVVPESVVHPSLCIPSFYECTGNRPMRRRRVEPLRRTVRSLFRSLRRSQHCPKRRRRQQLRQRLCLFTECDARTDPVDYTSTKARPIITSASLAPGVR